MEKRKYKYFTLDERLKLETYYKEEKSVSEISKLLNRSRGSIYRELKKGEVSPNTYSAIYANQNNCKGAGSNEN